MRMTRSNEVYRRWGAFKESEWIGHSRRVREDHYLTMTDADFKEAAEWTIPSEREEKVTPLGGKKLPSGGFPPNFPPALAGKLIHGVESVQNEKHR